MIPAARLRARLFRSRWALEDAVRGALWPDRRGFEFRRPPPGQVTRAEPRTASPPLRAPRSAAIGVIGNDADASPVVAAGALYGVPVTVAAGERALDLLARAAAEGWPLVAMTQDGLRDARIAVALHRYLAGGGTAMVECRRPGSTPFTLPGGGLVQARSHKAGVGPVLFAGHRPDFVHEFAGLRVEPVRIPVVLGPPAGADVLAWTPAPGGRRPLVLELRSGAGRILVAAGAELEGSLADAFNTAGALACLPALMAVRSLYGRAAWHPAVRLANFTIDDPALRGGRLGFDYRRLIDAAASHDFHVTMATIPRELTIADPETVELLKAASAQVSVCYHGNDHAGYEFFLPDARWRRYRPRALAAQEEALARARRRGARFSAETGLVLDRVMVFPHGVAGPGALERLAAHGFLATSNFNDREPLGATRPAAFDVGMRPADVYPEWSSFPLLWRRGLNDPGWIFDLYAGRPVLTFAHPHVPRLLERFGARAHEVNRAGAGAVQWTGLESVARHAYLQKTAGGTEWTVLMYANEACLHNPDREARTYRVTRPHPPPGWRLAAASAAAEPGHELVVSVPPGGTEVVHLTVDPSSRSESGGRCNLGFHADPAPPWDFPAATAQVAR